MIEDIKSGNGVSFASGKLRELCKLLPEDGEVLVTVVPILYICILTGVFCVCFFVLVFFRGGDCKNSTIYKNISFKIFRFVIIHH